MPPDEQQSNSEAEDGALPDWLQSLRGDEATTETTATSSGPKRAKKKDSSGIFSDSEKKLWQRLAEQGKSTSDLEDEASVKITTENAQNRSERQGCKALLFNILTLFSSK